jgi:hypothetical protein
MHLYPIEGAVRRVPKALDAPLDLVVHHEIDASSFEVQMVVSRYTKNAGPLEPSTRSNFTWFDARSSGGLFCFAGSCGAVTEATVRRYIQEQKKS